MIDRIFDIVATTLEIGARHLGITYNTINILVYYLFIPLTWTLMIDYLIGLPVTTTILAIVWLGIFMATFGHFQEWCDAAFESSANFLLSFKGLNWGYNKASVIICVLVPIIIYVSLITLCICKLTNG